MKNKKLITILLSTLFLTIPLIVQSAIYPYQGGTGTSTTPTDLQFLIGQNSGVYGVRTFTAGDNISFVTSTSAFTITADNTSNWSFDTNFGVSNLTPSTTIPVWFKDAIYASSTAIFDGEVTFNSLITGTGSTFTNATITNATMTTLVATNIAGTLTGDLICTDCLNATEIEDIYFLLAGDVVSASSTFLDDLTVDGDFIFSDEIKPDGDTCSNTELLQKTGADDWDCVTFSTAGGSAYLPLAGGTMTGFLTLNASPTADLHAATKEYVDTAGGAIISYFFTDETSGFINTFNMLDRDTGESQTTLASTSMASGDAQVLWSFISSSTPAFNTIAAGTYTGHFHFQRTGGNREITPYWELYASSTDGTQTLIVLSEDGDTVGDVAATDNIHGNRGTDYELTSGDKLVLVLYADVAAGGAATDITLTMEGTEDSRIDIVAPGNVFSDFFVRRDGSVGLTANWNAGSFYITATGFTGKASTTENLSITSQATGSIVYYSGETADQWIHLAIGSVGQVLEVAAGLIPEWDTDNTGSPLWIDFGDHVALTASNTDGILVRASSTINFLDMDYATITTSISLPTDSINDTHIDWGTGANQVSIADLSGNQIGGALVWDFGEVTSLELPNSAACQTDALGEACIDSTSDQLRYYGSATRTISYLKEGCFTIENLAAADDDLPVFSNSAPITVTAGWGHCIGTCTTNATLDFEDSDGNEMTMTDFTTSDWGTEPTPQAISGANILVAYEGFSAEVTNAVAPETDTYLICFSYTINED